MPRSFKLALTLLLVAGMLLVSMLPLRFEVTAPRLGMPVIVQAGDKIQVQVRTSMPFWHPHWKIALEQRSQRTQITNTQQHSQLTSATISFQIPSSLGVGTYSLVVSDTKKEQVRPAAIHIVSAFPDAMSIVQLADLPTLGNPDGDQRMQQLVDEINIINPDLVLMTGDVAYGGQWRQYRALLAAMARFNAPVVAAPGNHEYEGWSAYLALLGMPYHSVRDGNLQVISLNSGHGRDQLTETQYAWLRHQFQQLKGRVPIVQLHHPILHRKGLHGFVANHVHDMVALFRRTEVPIVLSGHWHGDAVYDEKGHERRDTWQFPGVAYVTTTTAGADLREDYATSPMHHGYRLIRLKHGKLQNYTYDMDGNGVRDATSSIPVGHLHSEQLSDTSAEIVNDLNENFANARLRIKVAGNHLSLVPDQGKIADHYLQGGMSVYAIDLPLPAHSKHIVHLIEKGAQQ